MNYDTKFEKPTDVLNKMHIHNKSSNLAFGMNDKVELLKKTQPLKKGEINDERK